MPITYSELVQIRAFSRLDGLWLALFWTLSFLLIMVVPGGSLGSLLALSTPIFMWWRVTRFRDGVTSGLISFRRSLYYSAIMISHAICVFALVQFVYFKFIDGGRFVAYLSHSVDVLTKAYSDSGIDLSQLVEGVKLLAEATPMELVMSFMIQNFMLAIPLCVITAITVRRNRAYHNN